MAATPPWFHYRFDTVDTETLTLTDAEANHIIGARRLQVGDQLILSNGNGGLIHCMLEQADRKNKIAVLRVSLTAQTEPPQKSLVLASALPKGDRLSTMLDMACQAGMTHFQPLVFERSVSKWNDKLKARCERIVIESAKQSKRAWVPHINACVDYAAWLEAQREAQSTMLLADQFGCPLQSHQSTLESAVEINLIIGPEGGLSEQEIVRAHSQDIKCLRLTDAILRIETAAIAGLSAINAAILTS